MRTRTRSGLPIVVAPVAVAALFVIAAFAPAPPPFGASAAARSSKRAAAARVPVDPNEVAARLVGEELVANGAWPKLEYLADRIGPRLSGSPGAAAAVAWTLEEFRRNVTGIENRAIFEVPEIFVKLLGEVGREN